MATYNGTLAASATSSLPGVDAFSSSAVNPAIKVSTSGDINAIFAYGSSTAGYPTIYGSNTSTATSGTMFGLYGLSAGGSFASYGVYGYSNNTSIGYGVYGKADGSAGVAVQGYQVHASGGAAVAGQVLGTTAQSFAIYGAATGSAYAGFFAGNVKILGTFTKPASEFLIDHPVDPENKTLSHTCIESPDMKNVYDGVGVADAKGELVVDMPAYCEALNDNFRYQLTAIGEAAPGLHLKQKLSNGRFMIAGAAPGQEICWMLTGIRKDAWARAHRHRVEEDKPADQCGLYLYPVEHGQPEEKGIHAELRARMARRPSDAPLTAAP